MGCCGYSAILRARQLACGRPQRVRGAIPPPAIWASRSDESTLPLRSTIPCWSKAKPRRSGTCNRLALAELITICGTCTYRLAHAPRVAKSRKPASRGSTILSSCISRNYDRGNTTPAVNKAERIDCAPHCDRVGCPWVDASLVISVALREVRPAAADLITHTGAPASHGHPQTTVHANEPPSPHL
jgi:hypothetical protein